MLTGFSDSDEMMTVKLRYKWPEGDKSIRMEVPVADSGARLEDASNDFHFTAAVAGFGLLLRNSQYSGVATFEMVSDLAQSGTRDDDEYRIEFLNLARQAAALKEQESASRQ